MRNFIRLMIVVAGIVGGVLVASPVMAQKTTTTASQGSPHAEMMADMHRMHSAMLAGPMTGNADIDFAVMMIPHHQGAIDMAKWQLKYGKDEKLRELAKQIIESQEKEILEMRERIKELKSRLQTSGANMGTTASEHKMDHSGHSM